MRSAFEKIKSVKLNIKNYSSFASVFLVVHNSNVHSEVVYSDIEPDIILSNDLDSYSIEIDNNGSLDFVDTHSLLIIGYTPMLVNAIGDVSGRDPIYDYTYNEAMFYKR